METCTWQHLTQSCTSTEKTVWMPSLEHRSTCYPTIEAMTVLLELKYGNLYVTIPYTVMHYYRETRVNAVIGAQVYLLSKQRSNDSFTGAEVWKPVCDNTLHSYALLQRKPCECRHWSTGLPVVETKKQWQFYWSWSMETCMWQYLTQLCIITEKPVWMPSLEHRSTCCRNKEAMTVLLELKYGNLYVTIPYTVMHYYRETRVNAVIGAQVYLLSKQRSNDSFTGAEVWKPVCDNTLHSYALLQRNQCECRHWSTGLPVVQTKKQWQFYWKWSMEACMWQHQWHQ